MGARHVEFRIGEVFPPKSPIARFLARLCVVTNDLMLSIENSDREYQRTGRLREGVPLHYLYTSCSHFREAVKVLDEDLSVPEVAEFVSKLDHEALDLLARLQKSFVPWKGSFVETRLRPLRDRTFHYLTATEVEESLTRSTHLPSSIDLGTGTYLDTRYDFADQIVTSMVSPLLGMDEAEITETLETLAELVRCYVYFTHQAVTEYLRQLPREVFTVIDRS